MSKTIVARAGSLLRAITKGPWELGENWEQGDPGFYVTSSDGLVLAPEPEILKRADADFIAASPELVTELLAELRRLSAERDELSEQLSDQKRACCCL